MNSKLQRLFDSLELERNDLIATVKTLSPDKQQWAPEGKWSVRQILAHIIAGEKLSVQYLNKKILGIKETKDTGHWEEIKMILLQASQRLPLKFKAPRAVVENTTSYISLEALIDDWDKTRADLKSLLERFDDIQIRKKIYKHVQAGRLNIQHGLVFLREHIIHHRPQINRLLSSKD